MKNTEPIKLAAIINAILLVRTVSLDGSFAELSERPETIQSDERIKALCQLMQGEISAGLGYCLLELANADQLSNQEITSACWNIFTSLCRPVKQYGKSNNLIYEVKMNPNAVAHSAYSSTSRGEGCHTDGAFLEQPPFYVALACLQPSTAGGESILVDGKAVFNSIEAESSTLALRLLEKYHIDCSGQFDEIKTRHEPIISFDEAGRIRVRYMRAYIESGEAKVQGAITAERIEALDCLDRKILTPEFRTTFGMSRGQIVIFNNHRLFHGRTEFTESSESINKRLLLRFYGQPWN